MTAAATSTVVYLSATEQDAADLDAGEQDRGHDHHVEEDAQVHGPEAAQEDRGPP